MTFRKLLLYSRVKIYFFPFFPFSPLFRFEFPMQISSENFITRSKLSDENDETWLAIVSLSLSLFLPYRLSFERMNERLERGSLRFSELTFPRHPWNCESIALVTVIIRFVPLTLRDCFIRIILIIDIPSFFFFDINSSNNFKFSVNSEILSLSLSHVENKTTLTRDDLDLEQNDDKSKSNESSCLYSCIFFVKLG